MSDIDAGKFSGPHLLAALTTLGLCPEHNAFKTYTFYGGSFRSDTGAFTFTAAATLQGTRNAEEKARIIKRAYSAEILKSQAKRFGWTLKPQGKDKFAIIKR